MKILFTTGRIHQMGGGAERSATTLIERLAKKHEVTVFNIIFELGHPKNPVFAENSVRLVDWEFKRTNNMMKMPYNMRLLLFDLKMQRILNRLAEEVQPDLVIAQKPPVIYSNPTGGSTPIITFVRDLDYIDSYEYTSPLTHFYNSPFVAIKRRWMLRLLRKSDLVIANSRFMVSKYEEFGVKCRVVYPFIERKDYCAEGNIERCCIGMVAAGLSSYKGVDIFLKIARRMPGERFMLAGRKESTFDIPENVEYLGWQPDVKGVLARLKLLLVPSRGEEAFGRTPIEAGINGIPSIVSNRGGLKEAVGNGGIVIDEYTNVDRWVDTIRQLLSNQNRYDYLSRKAVENAKRFEACHPYDNFVSLIKKRFGIIL